MNHCHPILGIAKRKLLKKKIVTILHYIKYSLKKKKKKKKKMVEKLQPYKLADRNRVYFAKW